MIINNGITSFRKYTVSWSKEIICIAKKENPDFDWDNIWYAMRLPCLDGHASSILCILYTTYFPAKVELPQSSTQLHPIANFPVPPLYPQTSIMCSSNVSTLAP